ncbi:hypothetical protein D3C76_512050 [compost metagenome]
MRPILLFVCLLSCIVCLPASGNGESARQLNEIASRSRLLCASAMAYFNPREREPDPSGLTTVFHQLNMLNTLVQQQGRPDALVQPLQAMRSLFNALDGLPREQAGKYPPLVRQLLEQGRLLQQASSEAAAGIEASPQSAAFSAQSLALATLLQDYELRGYPLPDKQLFALSSSDLQALDVAVGERFAQLQASYPQHAAELEKIGGTYRFVRAQLQGRKGHAGGGAGFYLGRAISDLDELAGAVEQ